MQHHKYSLTELEEMLPWERQVYIDMLINYLEEENEKLKNQQRRRQMAQDRTTRLAEIYKSERTNGGGVTSTLGKAALEKLDPRRMFNQKGFLAAALPSLFKAYRATPDVKSKNPSLSPSSFNSMMFDEMNTNMRIVAKESLNLSRIAFDINLMKQNTATLVRHQNTGKTGKAATKGDMFFKKAGGRDAEYKSKFKKESKTTSPSAASA